MEELILERDVAEPVDDLLADIELLSESELAKVGGGQGIFVLE